MKVFKYFVLLVTAISVLGSLSKDVKGFIKGFNPELFTDEKKAVDLPKEVVDENELSLTGVFEYVYPDNTTDVNKNHYLEFKEGYLYYYGTNIDFGKAKESFLPGYFFTQVKEVILLNNKIDFDVKVNESMFYKYQISPLFRTEHNEDCKVSLTATKRSYKGIINKNEDRIIVSSEGLESRLFVRK